VHSGLRLPPRPLCCPRKMRVLAGLLLCIVTHACTVKANVEKTIFLAPAAVTLPDARPSLDSLRLHTLSHAQTILPSQLPVQFPSKAAPHGLESWYLLQQLEAGRRYEVRICWPATVSPTTSPDSPNWDMLLSTNLLSNPQTSGWKRSLFTTYSIPQSW
jgi:hypothetical protein